MIRFSIITVSDTRTFDTDTAGKFLNEIIDRSGWTVDSYQIVKDEIDQISEQIIKCCDELKSGIVITCGGTGLSERDVTPEATMQVCDRNVPGIAELMREYSFTKTRNAALSRAICMQRGKSIVINFPGSEKAARENWEAISDLFEHAIKMANGEGH